MAAPGEASPPASAAAYAFPLRGPFVDVITVKKKKKSPTSRGQSQSSVFYEPQLEETPQSDDNKCEPGYDRRANEATS